MSFSLGACCNLAEKLLNQHLGKARKLHRNPRVLNLPSGGRSVTDCRTQEHPTPWITGFWVFSVTDAASLTASEPCYQRILFIMV